MNYQPVLGAEAIEPETPIQLKTEWQRKGDRVNFFTKEASSSDFFDLLKAPASSLKEKTVIDGWLRKQGGKGIKANWRKRWFILTYDKYLYYYKTQQDELPTGVILLDDYEAVSLNEDPKRKFRFYIHNNEKSTIRIFHFIAEDQKQTLQWISAIEQVFKAPKLDNTRTKIIRRDVSEDCFRKCARLYVRVAEARKLPKALTGSSTSSYCVVDLQDKQVRTQTIWSTRDPMWMEEFYLDVHDPDEAEASITCWRMERAGKGDVIGKVSIPIKSLKDEKLHEQWYPLVGIDVKEYIAGEVHLKIEYKPEESLLLVQVVAAKNLAPMGVGGTSNPYIRLHLDKRKRKTKIMNRTLNPTFNDFFEMKCRPNAAEDVSSELLLVVWHRDKLNSVFMGKISIPFTRLEPNFLYDGWYMITADDGGVCEELDNMDTIRPTLIHRHSAQALGSTSPGETGETGEGGGGGGGHSHSRLPPKSWISGIHLPKSREERIKITTQRSLDYFDRTPASQVVYSVASDPPLSSSSLDSSSEDKSFTTDPTTTNSEQNHQENEKPTPITTTTGTGTGTTGGTQKERGQLGDIRIALKYTSETVLPNAEYEELLSVLMMDQLDVVYALGKATSEKEDVARSLSLVFELKNKAEDLIVCCTCREVDETDNPEVLFRANSLATKLFDYYMKLCGSGYLQTTLGEFIKEIYATKKQCEVDPLKNEGKPEDLPRNFANLRLYADQAADLIFDSIDEFPHKFRRICHELQNKVLQRYPPESIEAVRYTSISGFIFLRFFCAAILSPKLFGLMKEHPDMRVARTLTLLAKTLQNLSNLCEFGYKETFMAEMNTFILERISNLKVFIDKICTLPETPRREPTPEINFGREMASIHRHLVTNIHAIKEYDKTSPAIKKLDGVLQRLALVKERYELDE